MSRCQPGLGGAGASAERRIGIPEPLPSPRSNSDLDSGDVIFLAKSAIFEPTLPRNLRHM